MVSLGKCYKNNSEEIVKIVSSDEFDENVFIDNFGRSYFKNGKHFYDNLKYDLSEEIFEKGP
jgi:hypothetical protein